METKFQTSFIPKKPIGSPIGAVPQAPRPKSSGSLLMTIATILFIVSIVAAGGSYAYKQYLIKAQDTYKAELSTREKQFNTALIEQLKAQETKIKLAQGLLNGHVALSQIFDIIGRFTIENVRFMSLDVSMPTAQDSGIKISLQGAGSSLTAVAFQSKVFNQLSQYGLGQIVKNPILSNPTIGNNGNVSFGFTAVVDPSSLLYKKLITPAAEDVASSSQSSAADQEPPQTGGEQSPFNSQ